MAIDETVEFMNKKAMADLVMGAIRDHTTSQRNLEGIREQLFSTWGTMNQAAASVMVQNLIEMDPRQARSITELLGEKLPSKSEDVGTALATLREIFRPTKDSGTGA